MSADTSSGRGHGDKFPQFCDDPSRWDDAGIRFLMNAAPIPLLMVDRFGKIIIANARAEKLFGYQNHELIGRASESLIISDVGSAHPDPRIISIASAKGPFQNLKGGLVARRCDGAEIPIEIDFSPSATRSGNLIVSLVPALGNAPGKQMETNPVTATSFIDVNESLFRMIGDCAPVLIWV